MAKSNLISGKTMDIGHLGGQFLIAMPGMADPRFKRAVIFMCAHSEDGAMGIIINHRMAGVTFADLLGQLDLSGHDKGGEIPPQMAAETVYMGGPVETSRGFVLHSPDYYVADAILPVGDDISMTATIDILRDMAKGKGPEKKFIAMGYSGWAPGQLEDELARNGWLHCKADSEIIFDVPVSQRYERSLALLGIDSGFLSDKSGHA